MNKIDNQEIVALVLALEEAILLKDIGPNGLRILCKAAAHMLRDLNPHIKFSEE